MQAALLPERGVVKVAGDDARHFLNGIVTSDIGKVAPGERALCRAADAAGQDHRGFHRRRGRARGRRRLLPRLPEGAGADARGKADFLQIARQGDDRGPVGSARRDGGLGRRRRKPKRIRAVLRRSAPARAWACASSCRRTWRPRPPPISAPTLVDAEAYDAHRIALGVPRGGQDFSYLEPSRTKPTWTSSAASISTRAATSARKWCRASSIAPPRAAAWCRSSTTVRAAARRRR